MPFLAKVQALATTRTVIAILLGWISYALIESGIQQDTPVKFALAGVLLVVAVGLFLRTRWGLHAAVASILAIALFLATRIDPHNFSVWSVIHVLVMVWAGLNLWKNPDELWLGESAIPCPMKAEAKVEDSQPMISLVQLRSRPRYLEPKWIAALLSDAWNLKITEDKDTEGADGFIAGEQGPFHIFLTQPKFAMFILHSMDAPYFDSPQEVGKNVNNLRFSEVITSHSAWLAMDFIRSSNEKVSEQEAYGWIGKAVAAMADDETQALMAPGYQYFNLWSSSLEDQLAGEDPLRAFTQEVRAPVVSVPGGDPIENAIAEARRRWPEFVEAFKVRKPDDTRFIVKAPFTGDDGDVEHMWLEVFGLEPEYVHGHLINEPFHNKKLNKGSQVEVPISEVSDWICPDTDDNLLGNFTNRVVREAEKA